jgi:hypothetical protein
MKKIAPVGCDLLTSFLYLYLSLLLPKKIEKGSIIISTIAFISPLKNPIICIYYSIYETKKIVSRLPFSFCNTSRAQTWITVLFYILFSIIIIYFLAIFDIFNRVDIDIPPLYFHLCIWLTSVINIPSSV